MVLQRGRFGHHHSRGGHRRLVLAMQEPADGAKLHKATEDHPETERAGKRRASSRGKRSRQAVKRTSCSWAWRTRRLVLIAGYHHSPLSSTDVGMQKVPPGPAPWNKPDHNLPRARSAPSASQAPCHCVTRMPIWRCIDIYIFSNTWTGRSACPRARAADFKHMPWHTNINQHE